jgi:hypothetical protein
MSGLKAGVEGNAMTARFRPLAGPVFSVIVLALTAGAAGPADAAPSASHKAIVDTDIARIGFLDLKTFLVVPVADDGEIGLASEQARVISPETLFARQPRLDLLKSIRGDDGSGAFGRPANPSPAFEDDGLTLRVNGEPFTMSLGLEEALIRDIETNIRTWGNPGVFTGGPGFASAAYLGAMTRDVMSRIERLESMAADPPGAGAAAPTGFVAGPIYVIPTPSTLGVFVAGLFAIGWLRRRSGRTARGAF